MFSILLNIPDPVEAAEKISNLGALGICVFFMVCCIIAIGYMYRQASREIKRERQNHQKDIEYYRQSLKEEREDSKRVTENFLTYMNEVKITMSKHTDTITLLNSTIKELHDFIRDRP